MRIVPTSIPITGLENIRSIFWKEGLFFNPAIESLIISIPKIRTEKPISISAKFFFLSLFVTIVIITPATIRTGVKDSGFSILRRKLVPEISVVDKSQDVTVVPIFAPIITLMDCASFIIPEFTKPTSITVVADEL